MDPHLYALRAIPEDYAAHLRRHGCSARELAAVQQRLGEVTAIRDRLRKIERLILRIPASTWEQALRGRRYDDPRAG